MGPLETLVHTAAAFVEGEFDLWQRLAGGPSLLRHGLRDAIAQARLGAREPWDLVEQCWQSLADPRCAEEIDAFYRLDPDFERAQIDCTRLHRNARTLVATARVAVAACYCATGEDDQPLLLGCAQEAARLLSDRPGEGVEALGVADPDPVVTVHRTFDLLASSGWQVAGARLWTLTWLDSPWERRRVDVPVAGYHPQERGFLANLHLASLDGQGELVESPDRALHPLGPDLVACVTDTWARTASPSVSWCLTVRSGSLPPWLPLDGPSLAGPLAVGLRVLCRGGRYDSGSVVLGQPAADGDRLVAVGFEREKLEAVVEWNREQPAERPGAVFRRAAVPPDTALPGEDVEAFSIRGLTVTRVADLEGAARFVKPPRNWGVPALAVSLVGLLIGVGMFARGSDRCPSETSLTVAAMWSGEEQARFDDVLESFCQETGYRVQYIDVDDNKMPEYLNLRVADPPDVAMVPQPGLIRELVDKERLKPLGDQATARVRENYPARAQDVMKVGETLYGVWFKASNKSIWWYNPELLRARGVDPQSAWTWDQMMEAARRTKAAGPWLAIGATDGWPLTDLFENLYFRAAKPECYDALSAHAIRWNDDSVVQTLTKMRELFLEGGVMHGSGFRGSIVQVFGGDPKAATAYGADFVLSVIQSETSADPEEEFDYFEFPSVTESDPAVVAGGDIAVAFSARPGVEELLAFLATPGAAAAWARRGGFVSPNQKLDPSNYRDDMTKRAAQSLTQHLTGKGSFRFDLSDLQPPAFGADPQRGIQFRLQALISGEDDPQTVADKLEMDAAEAFGAPPWRGLASPSATSSCRNR